MTKNVICVFADSNAITDVCFNLTKDRLRLYAESIGAKVVVQRDHILDYSFFYSPKFSAMLVAANDYDNICLVDVDSVPKLGITESLFDEFIETGCDIQLPLLAGCQYGRDQVDHIRKYADPDFKVCDFYDTGIVIIKSKFVLSFVIKMYELYHRYKAPKSIILDQHLASLAVKELGMSIIESDSKWNTFCWPSLEIVAKSSNSRFVHATGDNKIENVRKIIKYYEETGC